MARVDERPATDGFMGLAALTEQERILLEARRARARVLAAGMAAAGRYLVAFGRDILHGLARLERRALHGLRTGRAH